MYFWNVRFCIVLNCFSQFTRSMLFGLIVRPMNDTTSRYESSSLYLVRAIGAEHQCLVGCCILEMQCLDTTEDCSELYPRPW